MRRFEVGDRVMFKADVEQYGRVARIVGSHARVHVWNSVTGEEEEHIVPLNRLYLDQ